MSGNHFFDKVRTFLGLTTEPPRNDFRNPIWGSDDDDDCDELYSKQELEHFDLVGDMHKQFLQQVHDMFKNFGSIFGDMESFGNDIDSRSWGTMTDLPITERESEQFDSNRIRDYYLKPGYHKHKFEQPREDIDLDGKISSNEISGLLKQKVEDHTRPQTPFDGNLVPGRSSCKTIITTSVTKPDGTIETRRIVKNGNEVVEETTTSTEIFPKSPNNPGINPIDTTHILSSFLRNFY